MGGRAGMVVHDVDDAERRAAPHCFHGGPLHGGQGFLGTVGSGDDRRDHGTASLLGLCRSSPERQRVIYSGCAHASSSRARVACSLRTTTAENLRLSSYPSTGSESQAVRTAPASKAKACVGWVATAPSRH